MKSFDDARALLRYAKSRQLTGLEEQYRAAALRSEVDPDLLIATKHLLDSLRSALDYTAYGLFEKALGPPGRQLVYYPYARQMESAKDFEKCLEKRMPGYADERPQVADVMRGLQHYSSTSFDWVPRFMTLSNSRKHHNLGDQLPVVIQGMQISTGSHQLTITGGSLVVRAGARFIVNGQQIPPGEYNDRNLPAVPPDSSVEIVRQTEVVFADDTSIRVFPFLRRVVEGVEFIVERLIAIA